MKRIPYPCNEKRIPAACNRWPDLDSCSLLSLDSRSGVHSAFHSIADSAGYFILFLGIHQKVRKEKDSKEQVKHNVNQYFLWYVLDSCSAVWIPELERYQPRIRRLMILTRKAQRSVKRILISGFQPISSPLCFLHFFLYFWICRRLGLQKELWITFQKSEIQFYKRKVLES